MPEKESQEQLAERLRDAETLVAIGGLYYHYKNPDQTYTVRDVILDEDTGKPRVSYQANYGARIKYGRPLANWFEIVEFDGKAIPRFTKIDE